MIINVAKRRTKIVTLYEHSADGPRTSRATHTELPTSWLLCTLARVSVCKKSTEIEELVLQLRREPNVKGKMFHSSDSPFHSLMAS